MVYALTVFPFIAEAQAKEIKVESADELECSHPYENNSDIVWKYIHPTPADSLTVTFSEKTNVEKDYDYIYIYGEEGGRTKYTGTELAGKTVAVLGSMIKIELISDSSGNDYGFSVTNIEGVISEGPVTNLSILSNTIDTVTLSFSAPTGAESVAVEQSEDGTVWTEASSSEPILASSFSAVVTGLEAGKTYYFRLKVVGGSREGISNRVSVALPKYTPEKYFKISSNGSLIGYSGSDEYVVIPPEINGQKVESINDTAFSYNDIVKNIIILDGLKYINRNAFRSCDMLSEITVPDSVKSIGNSAFEYCTSLSAVSIGEGTDKIGEDVFEFCPSLRNICKSGQQILLYR